MAYYENISPDLSKRMEEEKRQGTFINFAFDEANVLRRRPSHDTSTVWRTAFVRDCDKILNCPYYSRYADKTQVFSLYKNDDITHRSLHVQLVSRIARTIGKALHLNVDLIEAIALGHDIGHTPFGHTGELFLDECYRMHTGKRFAHNIHSVRVLDEIFPLNLSLQTLDGIAAHNGELELEEYRPKQDTTFALFDEDIRRCYEDIGHIKELVPSTLEGCVVRISDIIAYLGKDRHDAEKNHLLSSTLFQNDGIGTINAEIVNNLMVNIIENSYGKPYIKMDSAHFSALQKAKRDNYAHIYQNSEVTKANATLKEMLFALYERLYNDLVKGNTSSPIFSQHIRYLNQQHYQVRRATPYEETEKNLLVVDYIASMTDDYFIDLYRHLFPKSHLSLEYKGYFDKK